MRSVAGRRSRSISHCDPCRSRSRRGSSPSRIAISRARRLAARAFAAGAGTSFDLVDAGKAERNAELDLAVKEFDLIKARITAVLATATCTY